MGLLSRLGRMSRPNRLGAGIAQQVARYAGDPEMPLMQGAARSDAAAAAQQIMSARNADELLQIAAQLDNAGGETANAMAQGYGRYRF